jgi:ubiquinone/menaquinone biosynthesis C-methylase UbiE
VDAADEFNRSYESTNRSRVYREAVRASLGGLHDWLVPFSITDGALLERIASELRVGQANTFLDLACGAGGPGLWVAERTGASLIGVDFAGAAIDAATALATSREMSSRARYIVADATATGLPDACVSGVMSIDALMFIDPERAAHEIARVLKPGGILVMTASESLVDPFLPTLVRDYRPVFEGAGFTTLEHEPSRRDEQQLALYRALDERAEELAAEIGDAAAVLLDEARTGLKRASQGAARVRSVLFVAERN